MAFFIRRTSSLFAFMNTIPEVKFNVTSVLTELGFELVHLPNLLNPKQFPKDHLVSKRLLRDEIIRKIAIKTPN